MTTSSKFWSGSKINNLAYMWIQIACTVCFYQWLNPYRQIPENFSKKRGMTQEISRKIFPDFFQILQFRGMTQGIFRKIFPGKFHEYLPMKKYFFPKTGHDSEAFPENFSRRISYTATHEKVFINKFWWHLELKWEVS